MGTMTEIDEHGRLDPPVAADEAATLLGFLDYQRATLAWKCSGLDAAKRTRRATTAASTMTLGGILKHMAPVEYGLFLPPLCMAAKYAPPWDAVDWKADLDREWRTAAEDSPEELFALWQRAVEQSRADVAAVLDGGDGLARPTSGPGLTAGRPACDGSCAT